MSLRDDIEQHLADTFGDGGCGWDEVAEAVVSLLAKPKHEARKPSPLTQIGKGPR